VIAVAAHAQGAILPVRAQPGARRNALLGEHAGALRVAVTAAPERGKANAAIAAVLADALACKASQIALLSGETAREKRFLIVGLTPEELLSRIAGTNRQDAKSAKVSGETGSS
jgi:uncharacterized protein YggU (UPF0235/DUF167 family)